MKSGARRGARPKRAPRYAEAEQRSMASDFAANYRANFWLSTLYANVAPAGRRRPYARWGSDPHRAPQEQPHPDPIRGEREQRQQRRPRAIAGERGDDAAQPAGIIEH